MRSEMHVPVCGEATTSELFLRHQPASRTQFVQLSSLHLPSHTLTLKSTCHGDTQPFLPSLHSLFLLARLRRTSESADKQPLPTPGRRAITIAYPPAVSILTSTHKTTQHPLHQHTLIHLHSHISQGLLRSHFLATNNALGFARTQQHWTHTPPKHQRFSQSFPNSVPSALRSLTNSVR